MLSDEQLQEIWKDEKFAGAYSGARTFQSFLKTQFNETVSLKKIYSILKNIPSYLISQRPIRRFPMRHYDIGGYGQVVEADICFMFEKNNYKYILVTVDCFSHKIFAKPLHSKSSAEVQSAFEIIFKEFNAPITTLATDQGTEFVGLKNFFKKNHIRLIFKYGKNKARYAEHACYLIKYRLFLLMRTKVTDNWVLFLPDVIRSLNDKEQKSLGNVKPSEIKSELDDGLVRIRQKEKNLPLIHAPDWKSQNLNQTNYDSSEKDLQVGTLVYVDKKTEAFQKSFWSQRGELFRIYKIDASSDPQLYYVQDLKDERLKTPYYSQQLRKGPQNLNELDFEIEKVLKTRKRRNKTEYLVKYLYYGDKFNQWIDRCIPN